MVFWLVRRLLRRWIQLLVRVFLATKARREMWISLLLVRTLSTLLWSEVICTLDAGPGNGRYLRAAIATPSRSHRLADRSRSRVFGKHCALTLSSSIRFWTLSGTRLVCHCRATEDCHGDVLIEEFRKLYPAAHDRNQSYVAPPGPEILNFLARLREEPESDEGSSADEGVPDKFAGHRGNGPPMKVGVGYVQREFCDGQSLASPGRWSPEAPIYPSSTVWSSVRECFWRFTTHYGTEKLLVDLAMGKVEESPFPSDEILQLKKSVIDVAGRAGIRILRKSGDRVDVPIDYRFLDVLLRAADDPEVGFGEYAQGVKVGPGTRMPRLPALYKPKKNGAFRPRWTRLIIWSMHRTGLEYGAAIVRHFESSRRRSWMSCTTRRLGVRS